MTNNSLIFLFCKFRHLGGCVVVARESICSVFGWKNLVGALWFSSETCKLVGFSVALFLKVLVVPLIPADSAGRFMG